VGNEYVYTGRSLPEVGIARILQCETICADVLGSANSDLVYSSCPWLDYEKGFALRQ